MITRIQLKNFKSFENLDFNLCSKAKTPRPLVLIYGENGSGKSNLISSISLLCEMMDTLDVQEFIEEILHDESFLRADDKSSEMVNRLLQSFRTTKNIIHDYWMVGSDGPLSAQYDFIIDGKDGSYLIEFSKDEIIHERLEYVWESRRGVYFDCSPEKFEINRLTFKDSTLQKDVLSEAKRFWGRHSLLAIISHYLDNSSKAFSESSISSGLKDVLNALNHVNCNVENANDRFDRVSEDDNLLMNLEYGLIPADKLEKLDNVEKALNVFFTSTNSNIQSVFYKKTEQNQDIKYELYFKKLISNQLRDISITHESSGTQHLLDAFVYLIQACLGNVVAVDEIDSGIHDALFQKVIKEIQPYISGQLIFTTHNTMLMDTNFARDVVYIIREVEGGNKEIISVTKTGTRTYLDNNVRSKYLSGDYNGLPRTTPCDVEKVIEVMKG